MRTDFVSCGCQLNCVIHNLWKHSRPTLQIGTLWDNIWCFAYFVLYNSEHPRTQQMKSSAEMHTYRMSKKYRFLEWDVSYGCQRLHLVGQFTPISPAVRVRDFGWKKPSQIYNKLWLQLFTCCQQIKPTTTISPLRVRDIALRKICFWGIWRRFVDHHESDLRRSVR